MDKSYVSDKQNRSEAGFTLIETTIAMVLLAIVGLGVAGCFFYQVDTEREMAKRKRERRRNPWPFPS